MLVISINDIIFLLALKLFNAKVHGGLTLSENCGLGIPAAKDLNRGVTWIGELNSNLDEVETIPSLFICSSQYGSTSARIHIILTLTISGISILDKAFYFRKYIKLTLHIISSLGITKHLRG